MSIVMGLDQHRGQITAEWIDTATGEIARSRVAPADRRGVRRFLGRFEGLGVEVALEATTGWRFVVEELRGVGAQVHLAQPAETSALRGNKKSAKNDRADARHLRELLMASRLPESRIPPDHILDLRARVRLRHALVDQRGEWQKRMQAVPYHHGLPKRAGLLTHENRAWVGQPDKPLRSYARRQAGCKALMGHYGIGELTAVTILAELGDDPDVNQQPPLDNGQPVRHPAVHRPHAAPGRVAGRPAESDARLRRALQGTGPLLCKRGSPSPGGWPAPAGRPSWKVF